MQTFLQNLEKEMQTTAERMAENSHKVWAKKVCNELENNERHSATMPLMLVPWDLLTDFERRKDRFRAQEILKFFQYHGYRIYNITGNEPDVTDRAKIEGTERSSIEKRFAYNLLVNHVLLQFQNSKFYRKNCCNIWSKPISECDL